jgi:hypothetical protein
MASKSVPAHGPAMTTATISSGPGPASVADEVALFRGGPFLRLLGHLGLADQDLGLLGRRCFWLALIAWLPLFALNALSGYLWTRNGLMLAFVPDVGVHVKFLVALPLLLVAEVLVSRHTRQTARQFLQRELIPARSRAEFHAAIAAFQRRRESTVAEAIMLGLVAFVSLPMRWQVHLADYIPTWHAVMENGRLVPTPAGIWFACVSLALFHFLLLRWYFRLMLWARFLWQLSRIKLRLIPEHPDGAGGLGFLGSKAKGFTAFAIALGAYFSSVLANQILYTGNTLPDFRLEIALFVLLVALLVLAPLTVFSAQLSQAKSSGLESFDRIGERYGRAFDARWNHEAMRGDPTLLGSPDIQSLADLANGYAVVKNMRGVPFSKQTVTTILIATVAPLVPLLLTRMPWQELLVKLIKFVF